MDSWAVCPCGNLYDVQAALPWCEECLMHEYERWHDLMAEESVEGGLEL